MACPKRICSHVVFSESVTFTAPNLLINIPAGSYNNGEKYCLVVGQPIPTDTTIAATVGVTIGDDTTTIYPLVNYNCTNVNACQISSRSVYPVRVQTNVQEGVFKLIEPIGCCRQCSYQNTAPALPIPADTVTTTTGGDTGS